MKNGRFIGRKRSIFILIVLAFITFGIYPLIWVYQTTKELNEYTGNARLNPAATIICIILTCGLYQIYWWYRINGLMMEAQSQTSYTAIPDNKLLFILLWLFGFGIISMAILQSDLNLLWERAGLVEEKVVHVASDADEWTDY